MALLENKISDQKRGLVSTLLWGLMAAEGLAALAALLRLPSEPGSAVLFGYSRSRLLIAAAVIAAVLLLAWICAASLRRLPRWQRLSSAARRICEKPAVYFTLSILLFSTFLSTVALLALACSPAAAELVILRALLERAGAVLVWLALLALQGWALLALNTSAEKRAGRLGAPLRRAIFFSIAILIYAAALKIFAHAVWDTRFRSLDQVVCLPALVFLLWGGLHQAFRARAWYAALSSWLLLLAIASLTYTIYRHTAQWMAWENTPSQAYWNLLADAFLHGRLYLINPEATHDLTLYAGRWYVPNPPLPALVLLPFVSIFGLERLNMVTFSILVGALNAVLVYLVLEQAAHRRILPGGRSASLWLTALFVCGTPHWWLALQGRMWFVSQMLTFTCAALAVLFALRCLPAWLTGLSLGLAVLARPNVFTLWPLLLALTVYLDRLETGRWRWKTLMRWAVESAIPVCLAAAGLLFYNHIRFDDWFDFGYVTINGADWILAAVQQYGMFNVHFVPINFDIMLLRLPQFSLQSGCLRYTQSYDGVSLLATTPALIYLVRRQKANLWTAGAWLSAVLAAGLLLFYHNTGAWQAGYRYLLDFLLPLWLLLGVAVGERPSWLFKALTVVSMLFSLMGILWWFRVWPC
jgi:hypothetical protein